MRTETLFCSELDPKHVAWLQSYNWHRGSAQEVFFKWKTNEQLQKNPGQIAHLFDVNEQE